MTSFESSNLAKTVECSALLFDMDGVLIDSTPAVARVWRGWALERGFDPEEVVSRAHGRPSLTTVREYLPGADHPAENREVERREIEDLEGIIPLPGAVRLLESLPPDRWTIVTSCTRRLAEVRLRAAGLPLPQQMITATDVVRGKPDAEPYQKGAMALGFRAEECIVVEDAPAGIQSGKAAGARVIALTTTMQAPALRAAGADWLLGSCADIHAERASEKLILSLINNQNQTVSGKIFPLLKLLSASVDEDIRLQVSGKVCGTPIFFRRVSCQQPLFPTTSNRRNCISFLKIVSPICGNSARIWSPGM